MRQLLVAGIMLASVVGGDGGIMETDMGTVAYLDYVYVGDADEECVTISDDGILFHDKDQVPILGIHRDSGILFFDEKGKVKTTITDEGVIK